MDHHELVNVRLSDNGTSIIVLDQTLLPNEVKYVEVETISDMYDAIATLQVRGAPAIGIFAAYSLYIIARHSRAQNFRDFRDDILKNSAVLSYARPTAVNLRKQLKRMEALVDKLAGAPIPEIVEALRIEAETIREEDVQMCRAISENGLKLIKDGYGVLTYCNTGPLATSRYGTGIGPLLLAKERDWDLSIYCCETRPLLQGARLTTFEFTNAGINCTLLCDNMASIAMSEGLIDAVFVGCDRVARNGDVANKVGTSGLAILAWHYKIPFYVFCPSSSYDPECMTGGEIEIEMRSPAEIKELYFNNPVAPSSVKCYNPSFDVTSGKLITAIVTEKGICKAPVDKSLHKLLK